MGLLSVPVEVMQIVLSYDELVGIWVGLSLRLTCRRFGWLVEWASMNTVAGRRFVERVLHHYAKNPVQNILGEFCGGSFRDLFDRPDAVDLVEIAEVAVQMNDAQLINALYGNVASIPHRIRHSFISYAIRHHAFRVVTMLIDKSAHMFTVAVYEAVGQWSSRAIAELRQLAAACIDDFDDQVDDHNLAMQLLKCDNVMTFDFTGRVDAFHILVLIAVKCDNGNLFKRLLDGGVELYWYDDNMLLKPGLVRCVAHNVPGGVAWLARHDSVGTSLQWLTGSQIVLFMTIATPLRRSAYQSAAASADVNVFKWVAQRWPDNGLRLDIMLNSLISLLKGAFVSILTALDVFFEFDHRLTPKQWQAIVERYIDNGSVAFHHLRMRFEAKLGQVSWRRIQVNTLLECHPAIEWAAQRNLLSVSQCMGLVARLTRYHPSLPSSVLNCIVGMPLRMSHMKTAVEMGHYDNAEYLLRHTKYSHETLEVKNGTLLLWALKSNEVACLRWVLSTFVTCWTPMQRKNVLVNLTFPVSMAMEHMLLNGC